MRGRIVTVVCLLSLAVCLAVAWPQTAAATNKTPLAKATALAKRAHADLHAASHDVSVFLTIAHKVAAGGALSCTGCAASFTPSPALQDTSGTLCGSSAAGLTRDDNAHWPEPCARTFPPVAARCSLLPSCSCEGRVVRTRTLVSLVVVAIALAGTCAVAGCGGGTPSASGHRDRHR